MSVMRGLTLNQKEQARLRILNGVLEGSCSVGEASGLMGISERHTWRLVAAYRKEGASALSHGNRGRRPAHSVGEEVKKRVIELAKDRYAQFNHTHLAEVLQEREGISLSRPSVRRIVVCAGLNSPRQRRRPKHRVRRDCPGRPPARRK